jgi:hypothetical protein
MPNDSLTAQRAKELLEYRDDGTFVWIKGGRGIRPSRLAGSRNGDGYIQICVDGVMYMAHRMAWLCAHGEWPKGQIDHINGNPADNRMENLRDVSNSVNQQNQRRGWGSSGLLGVTHYASKGRWGASILPPGEKRRFLGLYDTPEEAHAAYVAAKRVLHEGCEI